MTALQAAELKGVNMYRREVGVPAIEFDSELAAYANYRASESHYQAMIAAKNDLIGCGNCYKASGVVSQFDAFINL